MQCGRILRRATIFVRNAARSSDFYQRAFGFSVYSDQSITLRQGSPVTAGRTDDPRPARFITVKGTNNFTGMIGLISIDGDIDDHHRRSRLGIGSVVLVLEVEDIDTVAERVETCGGETVMPLHDAENTAGPGGEKIPSRRLFAKDPDGYLLEIFEPE